jgi:hypothetical protein
VLTLTHDVHFWFGRLDIWLEAVEVLFSLHSLALHLTVNQGHSNTYRVRKAHAYPTELEDNDEVTFFSVNSRLQAPDPRFLAIHAACAKVCHKGQMTEVIDKAIKDWENIQVLSEDGSGPSFERLRGALEVLAF